jgi:cell division protein FtsX
VSAIWIARHVRCQVQTHRPIVLAACAAFFLLTLVAGGARLGTRTVARWGSVVGQNVHVIVYLAEEVDQDRAQDLAEILRRVPTVAQVSTIEPATAMARFSTSASAFGLDSKALDGLEPAYFPRSLEVNLMPAADLSERAADLARRLRGVPGVLQVDAMASGLARLSVWVKLGRELGTIVLMALALVTLGALVAVFLRSRSAVAKRAAVLVQLGETAPGIRLPGGLWMAATAVVGGGIGALVLRLGWQPLVGRLERSLGIVTSPPPFPFLAPSELVAGLVVVLLVGLVMGYFATPLPRAQDRA